METHTVDADCDGTVPVRQGAVRQPGGQKAKHSKGPIREGLSPKGRAIAVVICDVLAAAASGLKRILEKDSEYEVDHAGQ